MVANKKMLLVFGLVTTLTIMVLVFSSDHTGIYTRSALLHVKTAVRGLFHHPHLNKASNITIKQWIVITTIASPTDDVRALAKLPGWQLLVVGDTKTPQDWYYPGTIYLSTEDQLNLGYKVLTIIPFKSYARKIIGYLYAIQNGARIIYETDDDNHPVDQMRSFLFDDNLTLTEMHGNTTFMNPYAYFGQSTIWPRGYPLEHIGVVNTNLYHMCQSSRPAVQQGLVDGDPDVDAVFRLTRKNSDVPINIHFSHNTPPILLPVGTFSPYNSQNTLTHYEAFWSLLLPITVNSRVTDIWRSYWAQRLMWLVGQQLIFLPPNAYQKRNSHSYLKDFVDENDLYTKAGLLVNYLSKWKCDVTEFIDCISKLSSKMADEGFWGRQDTDLVHLWIEDLKSLGYNFPRATDKVFCNHKTIPFSLVPNEQKTIFQHTPFLLELGLKMDRKRKDPE